MPNVGIGWLRGSIRGADPDAVLELLRPFFGRATPRAGATRWYRSTATLADRRVLVAWDGTASAAGTVMVDVTQGALDGLGTERALYLAGTLVDAGFLASRLDVYVDDHEALADPTDVLAALEAGDVVTHAQGHEWRSNSAGGATAYIGSRTSERYLRAYRLGPTHGRPGTRWELESKGEAARSALRLLTASHDPMTDAVRLIVSFVDFRARAGTDHGSRAPRLSWWAALVGSLTKVKGTLAVVVDSLANRAGWLRRQVAPTLAALWASPGYGTPWLQDLLSDGLDRQGGLTWAAN